jgi:hypothetical protein
VAGNADEPAGGVIYFLTMYGVSDL